MSSVTLDDVRKVYGGDIVAVEGTDLDIESGEFITIVGPSGSGKSTLLRMVAGLEDITEGTLSIDSERVNEVQPQNRGVAMVFQNYALYPHMSVRKNMSYGLTLTTDFSSEEISDRVEEAAEMMGIGNLLEKKPGELSGGQQQRVATGRAIVREPKVFLMDEPLSNLDAKLRAHMRTELQRIQERLDTTTIYVTHDQEEALTMSDRIVVLNEGEVQQIGSPEDVYQRPANRFIADFIGSPSMNFFDIALRDTTLVGSSFEYPIPEALAERVNERIEGTHAVLGVRPESIEIADEPSSGTIPATLDVIELVGSDNYLYVFVGGEEKCTVRVPAGVKPAKGDELELTFHDEHVHLFDGRTGENLLADVPRTTSPRKAQQ